MFYSSVMSILQVVFIAVALAMDAFAVAVAAGISFRTVSWRRTLRLSWHFGFFQAAMPVAGWCAGLTIRTLIERFDHWVAFALLAFVGGHMIKESFKKEERKANRPDPTRGWTLVLLSIATSIDALAVGLSLAVLGVAVWFPAAVIGVTAAICTAAGLHLGHTAGSSTLLGNYAELTGGTVLVLLGLNILREHGVFAALL